MMAGSKDRKATEERAPAVLNATKEGLEAATGSTSSAFQSQLLDQATESLWLPEWKDTDAQLRAAKAAYDALRQMAPRSPLEGLLAAQMISTHNAAMECLRRAMMEDQTFAGREQNLQHAAKLMSLYERQLAALGRAPRQGQQKITVEHVTVEAGGQAIVGNVHAPAATPAASPAEPLALNNESEETVNLEDLIGASPKRSKERVRRGDQ